jgi:benzoyl-CoA reductase/2-hydroxyglutaryl-CoA dehydratase subunit BcrC/BadD/HgdB
MSARGELESAYIDRTRAARAARSLGRKVVGMVGATVPAELVLAAGAYPLTIAPVTTNATPVADRYMESHFDADVRTIFDAVVAGRFDWIDLLVIPRTADVHLELYYYLKEVVRLGEGDAVPPLHLYDLLHRQNESNREYGLERTRELRNRLSAATGIAVTDSRLRAAIEETNRRRRSIRQLLENRRDPAAGISGVTALRLIGAGYFLEPSGYAELLDRYLAEKRPPLPVGPRLLVISATALSDERLHRALEATGCVVVAEDDSWGSRAAGRDIDLEAADPLTATFDKYFHDVPSPRQAPAAARDEWLVSELDRKAIDAVVFYIPPADHWFGWDYPRLRDHVEAAGLPAVLLREDVQLASGVEAVATALAGITRQEVAG